MENNFKILWLFFLYFMCRPHMSSSQCNDSVKFDLGLVKVYSDGFLYPKERDTAISEAHTFFGIPCSLSNGKWYIKYVGTERVYSQFKIKNKKIEGIATDYHLSGKVRARINYKHNTRNGSAKFYYESGVIQIKSRWKNGKRSGTWKYYNEAGKIYHIKKLKEDQLISETIFHDEIPEEISAWYKKS